MTPQLQPLALAFSTLAFPTGTLRDAVALGTDLGYQGVELRLIDGQLIDPAALDRAARARVRETAGALPIVAVDTSVRLTETEAAPILAFLQLAHDWECPAIRVFGGHLSEGPVEREADLSRMVNVLEQVGETSQRLGVKIGLETHDSFSAGAQVAELLARVPGQWMGAVWDSHHPHRMGEPPSETYKHIGSRLVLTQVKDARRDASREDGWQLVPLGDGEVPVQQMLSVLVEHGYTGVVSVEWERAWHPELAPAAVALPQHLQLLKRWLGDLKSA